MAHPNAELVRGGYEAFARGDVGAVMRLFHPDIEWHVGGRNALTGDYRGHDEVMSFFGRLTEMTGGSFRLEIHDITASDEHVVAILDAHAERDGRPYDSHVIHVWHVEDGKAREFRAVSIDAYADDEFYS
jgi:ketosteroid isomerase-like protein